MPSYVWMLDPASTPQNLHVQTRHLGKIQFLLFFLSRSVHLSVWAFRPNFCLNWDLGIIGIIRGPALGYQKANPNPNPQVQGYGVQYPMQVYPGSLTLR